ncbi:MAG: Citrate synthase (si), partial [uncultured Sphingosinicella sp.]
RGVRVQEVDRAAVPVPRQLARLRGELPAHDLRRPGRAVHGRPRRGQGARHAVHPARRPRAELLDERGARRGVVARRPVLGGGGGMGGILGSIL